MEKITEELKEKKEKSNLDKLVILNDPEIKDKIVSLKNEGTGKTWTQVANILNKDLNSDYSPGALQNVYEQELSLTFEVKGNKKKLFSDNIKKVKERYARINKTLDKYQEIVDKLVDEVAELDGYDLFERVDDLFRVGKQIEVTYKMVDKQISLLLEEQEKISIKAEKNKKVGYTDKEVLTKFKKYLPEMLRNLDIQKKIQILDDGVLKNN